MWLSKNVVRGVELGKIFKVFDCMENQCAIVSKSLLWQYVMCKWCVVIVRKHSDLCRIWKNFRIQMHCMLGDASLAWGGHQMYPPSYMFDLSTIAPCKNVSNVLGPMSLSPSVCPGNTILCFRKNLVICVKLGKIP